MRGNLEIIQFQILRQFPRIVCACSTRQGGVSTPPFESLNMGFSRGDDPDCVRENRKRFLSRLEISPSTVVVGQQVHGRSVEQIGVAEAGRGALDSASGIPGSDGLVTRDAGVFLFSLSADCPLLAILAPPDRGVTLAHCGWRGVAAGMPGEAVMALSRLTGTRAGEMVAVIGPGIGPCCYQVGADVKERLSPAGRTALEPDENSHLSSSASAETQGVYRLDLSLAIRALLKEAGMDPVRIEASPICSSCHPEHFFSHRRDGSKTGRIAMVIGITES